MQARRRKRKSRLRSCCAPLAGAANRPIQDAHARQPPPCPELKRRRVVDGRGRRPAPHGGGCAGRFPQTRGAPIGFGARPRPARRGRYAIEVPQELALSAYREGHPCPDKGLSPTPLPLPFVRCGVCCCGAVAPRVTAALLGRFLPRLGPLAVASGPFLSAS